VKVYTANDVAAELGIEPRALRRFLRSHPSYQNVGMGGRYMFTDADISGIRHDYRQATKGQVVKAKRKRERDPRILDVDPGMSPEVLELIQRHPFYREKFRRYRSDARAARQQRLRDRIAAVLPERYDDERVE
jgi:hypothetical protein